MSPPAPPSSLGPKTARPPYHPSPEASPSDSAFLARYGPWAMVAGAAEGLGGATAEALAHRGLHLWLVDRNAEALAEQARQLRTRYGVQVETQVLDLACPQAGHAIDEALGDRTVGLIAYVAAAAALGPFVTTPLPDHRATVAVNCTTPVDVLHRLLPAMVSRGRGAVILFSSLAGFQGSGQLSTYAASKAFDLVLGESLAAELEPQGIDVAVCCPGPTRTPAYERSAPRHRPAPIMEPAAVVEAVLAQLGRRTVIIPGWFNRLGRWVLGLMGRRRAVATVSRATLRMYPPDAAQRSPGRL